MITKNEIEARMRWTHGSRQAENMGRASPPNCFAGHGGAVGPWEIPAGLSAVQTAGALSAYRAVVSFWRAEAVGRSVSLPTFSFLIKSR